MKKQKCQKDYKKFGTNRNLPAPRDQLPLDLKFRAARPTPTDLQFSDELEYEDLVQDAIKSKQVGNFSNWALGACLVEAKKRFGEEGAQLQADIDIGPERALALVYVYERIPERIRLKELDWSHHREVAPLDIPDDEIATLALRAEWIQKCHANNWSVSELKQQLIDAGLRRRPKTKADHDEGGNSVEETEVISGPPLCASCGKGPGIIKVCDACMTKAAA